MIPLAAFEASLAFGWAGLACLVFPVSTVRAFRFLTVRGEYEVDSISGVVVDSSGLRRVPWL